MQCVIMHYSLHFVLQQDEMAGLGNWVSNNLLFVYNLIFIIGITDINRDFGFAKSLLVCYLSKGDLRNLFRQLGLAKITLEDQYDTPGKDQYADYLLSAWIHERDAVLSCGGATWENLESALRHMGQHGAANEI